MDKLLTVLLLLGVAGLATAVLVPLTSRREPRSSRQTDDVLNAELSATRW